MVCVSQPRLSARGLGAGRSASCRRRGRRAIVPRPARALLAEIDLSLVSHRIQEGIARPLDMHADLFTSYVSLPRRPSTRRRT